MKKIQFTLNEKESEKLRVVINQVFAMHLPSMDDVQQLPLFLKSLMLNMDKYVEKKSPQQKQASSSDGIASYDEWQRHKFDLPDVQNWQQSLRKAVGVIFVIWLLTFTAIIRYEPSASIEDNTPTIDSVNREVLQVGNFMEDKVKELENMKKTLELFKK